MLLTEEKFRKIVGSKFFTVKFKKKDGTIRKLNGKLGVTKHLKGGVKKYDASSLGYITVYDNVNKGYRTINLNTLQELKCGKVYR